MAPTKLMPGLGLSLDHVGVMVRDLDAGADRWRKLGFTLAPRSPQMGTVPGGKVEPWATANHCAMFRTGYLELIGIIDAERFNPWQKFMDRFEGTHITAFRCANADTAFSTLSERAEGLDPPVDRRRQAPYYGSTREMRFRNIFSRDAHYPEGRFIVIEHQTPDIIWQPELMKHENGAVALNEVLFRADDLSATRDRLAAILGVRPIEVEAGYERFAVPNGGSVSLATGRALSMKFPGADLPPSPSAAGVSISVENLSTARTLLEDRHVEVNETPNRSIWVPPHENNGTILQLTQA